MPVNGGHSVAPFKKKTTKDNVVILQYFRRGRNYKHHLVQLLQYTDTQKYRKHHCVLILQKNFDLIISRSCIL